MPRGLSWGRYTDDDGNDWSVRVDNDYFADPDRGWATVGDPAPPPLPRHRLARKVRGVDETGHTVMAVIPSVTAPLWTGLATAFTFNATDQLPHVATVISYLAERHMGTPHQ